MEKYLAVITTVLVATQVIRVTQNTISLRMNNKLLRRQLESIKDITEEDLKRQKEFYNLGARYFREKLAAVDDGK